MDHYKTLKSYMRHKDFDAFMKFVQTERIFEIEENDETLFYQQAPLKWQRELLTRVQPYTKSERQLFKNGNIEMLTILLGRYDVSERNLIWGFQNMDTKKLATIVRKLPFIKSARFEKALASLNNEDLFKLLIDKVTDLRPETKDFLRDYPQMANLRAIYNKFFSITL